MKHARRGVLCSLHAGCRTQFSHLGNTGYFQGTLRSTPEQVFAQRLCDSEAVFLVRAFVLCGVSWDIGFKPENGRKRNFDGTQCVAGVATPESPMLTSAPDADDLLQ